MTDVRETEPGPLRLILLFAAIAALMGLDVADDLTAREEAARLGRDLDSARADAVRWREDAHEALSGLSAAIDRQFARWELTEAEHGVALLLLKGMSHKEVATARDTAERTVRQQALAIYRKAGVHSRAELAAFFLRELPSVP